MKRLALALVLSALWATPTASEFTDRIAKFHQPYIRFIRAYFACPVDAHCDMSRSGEIDRKAFNEARQAAMALFDLREK